MNVTQSTDGRKQLLRVWVISDDALLTIRRMRQLETWRWGIRIPGVVGNAMKDGVARFFQSRLV